MREQGVRSLRCLAVFVRGGQSQQATYIAVIKLVRITGHVTMTFLVSSTGWRFYYGEQGALCVSIGMRGMDLIGRENYVH